MSATCTQSGFFLCLTCDQVNRPAAEVERPVCARCGARIWRRKPESISRSWAYLIAACILYIPANILPVLESGSLFSSHADTILSGAKYLWNTGSWYLAIIVFVASIVVPAAKIGSLGLLLVCAQRRSGWRPEERARLYRTTKYIGRWSMVDIFVGALLVALVQLRPFASIEPGPGAIAFSAVVVLTMLASISFDPRLTWDPIDDPEARARGPEAA